MKGNLPSSRGSLSLNSLKRISSVFLGILAMFMILTGSVSAQDNPTWGGKSKTNAAYQPKEIKDIFAKDAVTVSDMQERAKFYPYMQGEIVVALELPVTKSNAATALKEFQWSSIFGSLNVNMISRLMTTDKKMGSISLVHLSLPAGTDVFEAMKMVSGKKYVLWSSPNFYFDGDPRDIVPNDPSYGNQYHHPLMKNQLAWDMTYGSSNIVVGIADDGVEMTHTDLAANIWVNSGEIAGDGIDNDANGYIDDVNGWDFAYTNNNPAPNSTGDSHGTHVSGIVAARADNGIGVAGVAGHSKVMPLQFYTTTGGGLPWNAALINQTMVYAVDNGAQIINTSYNVDGFANDAVFIAAMQYALDEGVLSFNSAGNNGQLNPPRQVITQTLFVVSSTASDTRSSSSNYGTGMDITAPGNAILSTVVGNDYEYFSGTSMATPNAAGAAALIWSANPSWNHYQVAAKLLATADDISAANPSIGGLYGTGRVNSFAALTAPLPAPKVKTISGLPTNGGSGSGSYTSFTIAYNQLMDPAAVNNLSNIELRNAGPNNLFDDADDVVFAVSTPASYRIGTNSMTYNITSGALPCGSYRLKLSSGLRNPFNTALDGDGNGTAGDDYIQTFSLGTTYFPDVDGDGYGSMVAGVIGAGCTVPAGHASVSGDCDDNNNQVNPGRPETCNGLDDNCDGITDLVSAASATVFANNTSMIVPGAGSGAATGAPSSLYPSPITVSGITGTISSLTLKIKGLSHTWPDDIDMLLVSPTGEKMIILSDVGNSEDAVNVELTIADHATSLMPVNAPLISGTYKPTSNGTGDLFPSVPAGITVHAAPSGTATLSSTFAGKDPNGTWNLYVTDDAGGDVGSITGGWELSIIPFQTVCNGLTEPEVTLTQPDCGSSSGTISITTPLNPSYTYSIGGSYQSSPVFTNVASGSYSVTVKDENDAVSPALNVVINDGPVIPQTPGVVHGQSNVCSYVGTSTEVIYTVDPVDGATSYNWIVPPTVTLVSGQGTNSIAVTINNNFLTNVNRMFRVSASSACGTSAQRQFWLKAQQPATPLSMVASSTDICSAIMNGTPVTYTIQKVPTATSYLWTAQPGTIISHPNGPGVDDTTVSVLFNNTFTTSLISVRAENSCGTSAAKNLNITKTNPSVGLMSGPVNVCEYTLPGGTAAVYTVPAQSAGTIFNWTLPAGAANITGQGTNTISFNFPSGFTNGSVSVNAGNGCGISNTRTKSVTVLRPGTLGAIDVVQNTPCDARQYTYTVAAMPANTQYILWTSPVGSTILNGQGTTSITVSYPAGSTNGTVTATPQNNCGSNGTRSVSIKLADCEEPQTFTRTSIRTTADELAVDIFPNPASNQVNLRIISSENSQVIVNILDLHGRKLQSISAQQKGLITLGNNLKAGVYLIEVLQGKNRKVEKLIKL